MRAFLPLYSSTASNFATTSSRRRSLGKRLTISPFTLANISKASTAHWALPLPQPESKQVASPDGMRRYIFELDGLPPGAKAAGATLKITAVSPTDAIEVEARLD